MEETKEKKALIGWVAVDSGQLMLCDPCYIKSDEWQEQEYKPASINNTGSYPFNYNGACGATLSDKQAGELHFNNGINGAGVAFTTGLGDGHYPVYATYIDDGEWGLRIAKVEVVFLINDEELF